jgi:defect in organelle trafficking protein DotC
MKKMLCSVSSLFAVLILSGCASTTKNVGIAHNKIRYQAIQETAMTFGAQSALAWRAQRINQTTENHAASLDKIYPFFRMQLSNNVMPPVLAMSTHNLKVSSANLLREAAEKIDIVRPAFLAVTPPSWRDYLLLSHAKRPAIPNRTLLPNNHREQAIWNYYVQQGWDSGEAQADAIFQSGLARLNRDIKGMALYHILLSQKMITPPYVASAHMGITGDELSMRINDKIVRITSHSKLLLNNSDKWRPIIIEND